MNIPKPTEMDISWMIEIEACSFAYPGSLDSSGKGVSLQIKKGETVLLLGPSGSGKSTLVLSLCGLIPHAVAGTMTGVVRIAGLDTRETEPGELARVVGTVFQDPDAQTVMMTVEDEVAFGLENIGVPAEEMEQRMVEALSTVGLSVQGNRPVEQLSGGQKQRLTLASVLAMKPEVLVLDEPTANLDPVGTVEVFQTLRGLKSTGNYTMVLIEHKLDDLVDLVDRVVVMDDHGELICSGTPEAIFYDRALELEGLGVWFPQAVEVTRKLQAAGFPIEGRALAMKQLAEELRHSAKHLPANEVIVTNHEDNLIAKESINRRTESNSLPFLEIRSSSPLARKGGWLQPLELQVRQGEFWAIVGENGAGKTTLARHIMGLAPVKSGVLFIEGRDAASYPYHELARRIGYVFQNPEHQFVTERVAAEIAFGLKGMGLSDEETTARVSQLLERFGLTACANAHPFCLSHGQKRRLSVAVMLAVGQELLILDEPTFGQDRRHAVELMGMLKELQREGRTILMITHDMTLVAEYADHAAVMSGGSLLAAGPVHHLFADQEFMVKAGLKHPPIVELSQLLADVWPHSVGEFSFTVDGWVRRWMKSAAESIEGAGCG